MLQLHEVSQYGRCMKRLNHLSFEHDGSQLFEAHKVDGDIFGGVKRS